MTGNLMPNETMFDMAASEADTFMPLGAFVR
jgi:hypothetical protein